MGNKDSLRDILERATLSATTEINKNPVSVSTHEPVDLSQPPPAGAQAGQLIEDYGENAAIYIERQVTDVMQEAHDFEAKGLQLAQDLRAISAMQRKSNEQMATRLRAAAMGMGAITKKFFEE